MRTNNVEQADARGDRSRHKVYHRYLKMRKVRAERRRAKHNPECPPGYKRYWGYET